LRLVQQHPKIKTAIFTLRSFKYGACFRLTGAGRLGVCTVGSSGTVDGAGDAYHYQLTDHLGNKRAVVGRATNGTPLVVARTDYYPFGMPMPNRDLEGTYRYKFQGQERDKETGMEAFELRLWDSRIGRWLTTDPYGEFHSPYLGMGNNPIINIDPDGGMVDDCNCNSFFGRIINSIGKAFKGLGGIIKDNFGRYRKHPNRLDNKNYDKRWTKGSGRIPYNRTQRDFLTAVNVLSTTSIVQDFNIEPATLISPTVMQNNTITIAGMRKEIVSGQTTHFPGANFYNMASMGIKSTDGTISGSGITKLAPLTNDQVRSLVNLANFMVLKPNVRVNFVYPTPLSSSHPRFNRELMALYTESFQIITTILINNGVDNPNMRIIRSNGKKFDIVVINN
jgi:RHS repeat-associated protein